MASQVQHKDLTGDNAIHQIMYVQTSDPGAVGAGKFWLDTTGGASLDTGAILKQRDGADSSWTTRADLTGLAGGTTTPDADIYVATTGDDSTGDGSSGTPYLTVAHALSTMPARLDKDYIIHVADGTYAGAIDISTFDGSESTGTLKILGNTTTPANVTFTGTTSKTQRNLSLSTTVYVAGPVKVTLSGIKVNATADHGVWAANNAYVVVDRCTVTGTLSKGIAIWNQSYLELKGNITVSGFSSRGIQIAFGSGGTYTSAGTLTITASSSTASYGIHVVSQSEFFVQTSNASGLNITISTVQIGYQVGLGSMFSHQGPSATLSASNGSTPSSSNGVQCTDCSSFSANGTSLNWTVDHFTNGYQVNSMSYCEVIGTRTQTNLGATRSPASDQVPDGGILLA